MLRNRLILSPWIDVTLNPKGPRPANEVKGLVEILRFAQNDNKGVVSSINLWLIRMECLL